MHRPWRQWQQPIRPGREWPAQPVHFLRLAGGGAQRPVGTARTAGFATGRQIRRRRVWDGWGVEKGGHNGYACRVEEGDGRRRWSAAIWFATSAGGLGRQPAFLAKTACDFVTNAGTKRGGPMGHPLPIRVRRTTRPVAGWWTRSPIPGRQTVSGVRPPSAVARPPPVRSVRAPPGPALVATAASPRTSARSRSSHDRTGFRSAATTRPAPRIPFPG